MSETEKITPYDFGQEYDSIELEAFADEAASRYSAYVNLHRAIPDIRDGLKPSQRRGLYGTYDMGLDPVKPHIKSARVTGHVMGKFHPHGDSVYGAIILMSQDFTMNEPLFDIHGNNGSIDGTKEAASRYTEVRPSQAGYMMVKDIKRNAVKMIGNYDDTEVEPRVLPTPFPQSLLNGQSGIGWSLTTSIAPHNILELMDLSIYMAKTPDEKIDIDHVKSIFKGPDFMTGCQVVMSEEEYLKELLDGNTRFLQRSVVEYHVDKNSSYFSVKAIPYKVTTEKLKHQVISELVKSKAFGFEDIEDNSNGTDLDIRFIFKKGTDETKLRQIVDHLYKKTCLQESVTVNNVFVYKGRPQSVGVLKNIREFLRYRLECLKNMWSYDKGVLESRLNFINALLKLEDVTDEVIDLAKKAESKSHFEEELIKQFGFNEEQAEYIASLQLYRLGRTNFDALRAEKDEKESKVADLTEWLSDEKSANKQLINDLNETKKAFKGHTRKSEVIDANSISQAKVMKIEETIDDKAVKVVIKRDLEMFQIGTQAYNNQIDTYKEDDIVAAIDTRTVEYVMAVTKDGQTAVRLVNDLPRIDLNGKSEKLNKQIPDLKSDAEFVGGFALKDDKHRILLMTKYGYVKSILPSKAMPNTNTKIYQKKARPILKFKENDGDEIVLATSISTRKLTNHELHVTFNDNSKKSGKTVRKLKLDKYLEKLHGLGGNGSRSVNVTSKGVTLDYRSCEFVKIVESQKEEVVENV